MSDLLKRDIQTYIDRVETTNAGHSADTRLSRSEITRQELGQIINALSGNAQIGRLSGTLEQLEILKSLILARAERDGLTPEGNENYELFMSQVESAFALAKSQLVGNRE